MSKLSIKLRVTIWYTALMLGITLLVLGFMLLLGEGVMERDAKQRLQTIIDYNAEEVEYDDGELEIDDDDFDFYKNGVYALVYSDTFALIDGQLPGGFPAETGFEDGGIRAVQGGGARYLVYDRYLPFHNYADVWVRGILPLEEGDGAISSLIRVACITLPLLVLLAAIGGYFVTGRAFRPVGQMQQAASAIQEGKDLSLRLDIGPGQDELHKLADTFNQMLARLETSFEAEKQFTSDASHELRTPVSVILAQCEFALEQVQSPAEYQDALLVIRRQAEKMSRLISHLLTFTRLEQGTEQARFEHTDLSELIRTLCGEQAAIAQRGIALHTDIAGGIFARVDAALFARLFHNLVQNAFAYGRDGGNIHIALRAHDGHVSLQVRDDGIGIAAADLPKIWQRFYQINPSRTPDAGGSMGMGLAMVQQIAGLHGGVVTVESTLGAGSIFTFTFPQA